MSDTPPQEPTLAVKLPPEVLALAKAEAIAQRRPLRQIVEFAITSYASEAARKLVYDKHPKRQAAAV